MRVSELTYSDKDDIKEMYLDGLPKERIGSVYGLSAAQVESVLRSFPRYEEYKINHKWIVSQGRKRWKKECEFDGCTKSVGFSQTYCSMHEQIIKNDEIKKILEKYEIEEIVKRKNSNFIKYKNCVFFSIEMKDNVYILADLEDYDLLFKHGWHLHSGGYAETRINSKKILMHRLILDPENNNDKEIDHINLNKLDNRKNNLRFTTPSQNQMNRLVMSNNKSSGIRGITWDKSRNKWKVSIQANKINHNIGRFDSLEEAKKARLEAEKIYHANYLHVIEDNTI